MILMKYEDPVRLTPQDRTTRLMAQRGEEVLRDTPWLHSATVRAALRAADRPTYRAAITLLGHYDANAVVIALRLRAGR